MKLPQTVQGRPTDRTKIALAIALSLLLHTFLIFGPKLVELPPAEPPLPPLQAKLEPLPKVRPAPPAPKKRPPARPKFPETVAPIALAGPAPAPQEPPAPPAPPEPPAPPQPPAPPPIEAPPPHPLPKQAQLTFNVYKGKDLTVGEARHKLTIGKDGHYTLQVSVETVGLARMLKTFMMNQRSQGTLDARGLHPDEYSEGRVNDDKSQDISARFDWPNKTMEFSSGGNTALPDGSQDMLSFLYQLSQLPLDQPVLTLYISNGKKLEKYQLEIGAEDKVLTRNGKLRALPLRKIHAPGEEGLEVWLGTEYRLLPVKIVQIDRNGEVAGTMVVSDIRVSKD